MSLFRDPSAPTQRKEITSPRRTIHRIELAVLSSNCRGASPAPPPRPNETLSGSQRISVIGLKRSTSREEPRSPRPRGLAEQLLPRADSIAVAPQSSRRLLKARLQFTSGRRTRQPTSLAAHPAVEWWSVGPMDRARKDASLGNPARPAPSAALDREDGPHRQTHIPRRVVAVRHAPLHPAPSPPRPRRSIRTSPESSVALWASE